MYGRLRESFIRRPLIFLELLKSIVCSMLADRFFLDLTNIVGARSGLTRIGPMTMMSQWEVESCLDADFIGNSSN